MALSLRAHVRQARGWLSPFSDGIPRARAAVDEQPDDARVFRRYLAALRSSKTGRPSQFKDRFLQALDEFCDARVVHWEGLSSTEPASLEDRLRLSAESNFDLFRFAGREALPTTLAQAAEKLSQLLHIAHELDQTYTALTDQHSRQLLLDLCAYRVLGFERVKLSTNNSSYWRAISETKRAMEQAHVVPAGISDWYLDLYNLQPLGLPFRVFGTPAGLAITLLRHQYTFELGDRLIGPREGDVVIDGGACWGETSVHFAHQVGATGRVYAFEFLPGNIAILNRALDLNPTLRDRISLIPKALWCSSDEDLPYVPIGPGSHVGGGQDASATTKTACIDDFVRTQGLNRVDFIKMDIEGAELQALQGAEESLRHWKPRLAISVYHHPDDLATIPAYLDSLSLGYELHLSHSTIHLEETVLFAESSIR